MNRRGMIGLMAGAVLLSGCKEAGAPSQSKNSAEVRYKMTVEVETPEGLRSGSSVWSWRLSKPTVALASAYDGKFRGEAVAVDLPGGKTLFALVKGQAMVPERHLGDIARAIRGEERLYADRVEDIRNLANQIGANANIPCEIRADGLRGAARSNPRYDCPSGRFFTMYGIRVSLLKS